MVYSIEDWRSTKFVQMKTVGWHLTFLWQGQICVPVHLYEQNVEKSFSQNVLKTEKCINGWNLQCMIEVLKHFSYNQNFVPRELSALATRLYTCIKLCNFKMSVFLKLFKQFSPDFTWDLLSKGYCQFLQMVAGNWTRRPQCPYMLKTLKSLLLQNQESFRAESWYKASRTQDLPSCTNDYLCTARSNFRPHAFVWEKCWKVIFSECMKDKWLKLTMCD